MSKIQIGIIGASSCDSENYELALKVGRMVAEKGWYLVCGGTNGIMEAAAKGAKEVGGTTIGILPGEDKKDKNQYIDISIVTNMGHSRNVIIAHSSDILIAISGSYGTLSEIAIGLHLGKPVINLKCQWDIKGTICVSTPKEALDIAEELL
ncbi:TIGR00725 family protein [Methanosalsum natronophilum]|uniref:TIGR00725 family protein n=1 Tax=Methanosalsum natronophilum TaxID=768733 RepID=A0A3R7WDN9_9EURY|nr:TIGR00725 family protein [Methanosalsum natronophilum]MCS3924870.1 uncharacterized protein (TIGR00725 family) [Methanosalsum natronophilum]RQD83698.1 MAG: TIGR00725 family protein [Methanosalsum natronophilum]